MKDKDLELFKFSACPICGNLGYHSCSGTRTYSYVVWKFFYKNILADYFLSMIGELIIF